MPQRIEIIETAGEPLNNTLHWEVPYGVSGVEFAIGGGVFVDDVESVPTHRGLVSLIRFGNIEQIKGVFREIDVKEIGTSISDYGIVNNWGNVYLLVNKDVHKTIKSKNFESIMKSKKDDFFLCTLTATLKESEVIIENSRLTVLYPTISDFYGRNIDDFFEVKLEKLRNDIRVYEIGTHKNGIFSSDILVDVITKTTISSVIVQLQYGEVLIPSSEYIVDSRGLVPAIRKCLQGINSKLIEMSRYDNRYPNTRTTKYIGKKLGTYVSSDIPFSCEVECYGKTRLDVATVAKSLPSSFGVARDGSLSSNDGSPVEIQTPVLCGKRGEVAIAEQLCKPLVDKGFWVDKTCGMHIHLDGKKILSGDNAHSNLKNLYAFYRVFDPVIVSFLPSTRRSNNYCATFDNGVNRNGELLSVEPLHDMFRLLNTVKDRTGFEELWYKCKGFDEINHRKMNRYTIYRYFGVNFHSLLKDGHIEIRYHSGTLNHEKILYWIDLHTAIIEHCISSDFSMESLSEIIGTNPSIEKLTEMMFEKLSLKQDTVEYLMSRQKAFDNTKESDEILIDKTKTMSVV